ncbi:MAG TPA: hypothetical protein VNB90_17135 [Cytophagaceae bacterium]|jgi:hypothetical protein|nr:hypothetical protein [Cytophagaceae bacterium]
MNNARKIDFGFHVFLGILLMLLLFFMGEDCLGFILFTQFFVGIYQVFSAIGRTVKYHSFDPHIQKILIGYWIAVAAYGAGWLVIILGKLDEDYIMPYLLYAWIIAAYYCYMTYLIAFPKYIKSHLDI